MNEINLSVTEFFGSLEITDLTEFNKYPDQNYCIGMGTDLI